MTLPEDPMMLFSFINMKLRDNYSSLDELCDDNASSKRDACPETEECRISSISQREITSFGNRLEGPGGNYIPARVFYVYWAEGRLEEK